MSNSKSTLKQRELPLEDAEDTVIGPLTAMLFPSAAKKHAAFPTPPGKSVAIPPSGAAPNIPRLSLRKYVNNSGKKYNPAYLQNGYFPAGNLEYVHVNDFARGSLDKPHSIEMVARHYESLPSPDGPKIAARLRAWLSGHPPGSLRPVYRGQLALPASPQMVLAPPAPSSTPSSVSARPMIDIPSTPAARSRADEANVYIAESPSPNKNPVHCSIAGGALGRYKHRVMSASRKHSHSIRRSPHKRITRKRITRKRYSK